MENITGIDTLCDNWYLDKVIEDVIAAKAKKEHKPEWIEKMKVGMKLIGEACGENMEWGGCDNCPFDKLCTSINDDYWDHKWHDMTDTMRIVLRGEGYDV